jgi:hypothetical protein
LPPVPEVAPEDNGQHLLATSDVEAIADIALAPEFGRYWSQSETLARPL